jgi:hypothetical protein
MIVCLCFDPQPSARDVFLALNFEASKLASIGGLRNAYIEGSEDGANNHAKVENKGKE